MSVEMKEICESLGVSTDEVNRDFYIDDVEVEAALEELNFN